MRFYKKDLNKTAEYIISTILGYEGVAMSFDISKDAYDWLYLNANSLANLIEELLNDKLGKKHYVVVHRYKDDYGDYSMYVEFNEIN